MSSTILDRLFLKYTQYATSLIYKDISEANENETVYSNQQYKVFLSNLSDKGYFTALGNGDADYADQIYQKALKDNNGNLLYVESNEYYKNLNKLTGLDYITLRSLKHLGIVGRIVTDDLLTTTEEIEFKRIYNEELDYYNTAQYRYDFQDYPLFNKLALTFIIFSTIIRILKNNAFLSLNDQDIEEYYLNNFLVSHGFLLYNNINYHKKKEFVKHIVEFYNNKGSLNTIEKIINILHGSADIYEYYLFYEDNYDELNDVDDGKYYFLKVKPDESFSSIYSNYKADRQEDFDMVTINDDSWIATEEALRKKNIRFIKTKYFSIESGSDISNAGRELSFLINKLKKYREYFGAIHKFQINGISGDIEVTDFLMFLTLLAMRLNNFTIEHIKSIEANEDVNRYLLLPKAWEGKIKYESETNEDLKNEMAVLESKKNFPQLVLESQVEQDTINKIYDDMYLFKNEKKFDRKVITDGAEAKEYNNYDYITILKKKLNNEYSASYRKAVSMPSVKLFDYLVEKLPHLESYLIEPDQSLLSKQFLGFLDSLEEILTLYGQKTFKLKEVYSNLYLPKIIEIIKYFKSMNAYLLDFTSSLIIEKENMIDIISDSYTVGGLINISNRDKGGNTADDSRYWSENDYNNKSNIIDREVDIGQDILLSESIKDGEDIGTITKYTEKLIPQADKQNKFEYKTAASDIKIYLNNQELILGKDYSINANNKTITLIKSVAENIRLNSSIVVEARTPTLITTNDNKTNMQDAILYDLPIASDRRKNLIYSSFTVYTPYVTDYSSMIETDTRISSIIKDQEKYYLDGNIIDFYGLSGSYQELREKYNLSYNDFKEKVTALLQKHHDLFGTVTNRMNIKKEDYTYIQSAQKRLPFTKKPFLYRRMNNKVDESDVLYTDLVNRGTFTDAISVYELNLDTNKYEYKEIYNVKYRTTPRKESPEFEKEFDEFHTNKRPYKDFLDKLKEYKKYEEEEQGLLGEIPTPNYNLFLCNGKISSNIIEVSGLHDILSIGLELTGKGIDKNTTIIGNSSTDSSLKANQVRLSKNLIDNMVEDSIFLTNMSTLNTKTTNQEGNK